jgi:hypothetical protein
VVLTDDRTGTEAASGTVPEPARAVQVWRVVAGVEVVTVSKRGRGSFSKTATQACADASEGGAEGLLTRFDLGHERALEEFQDLRPRPADGPLYVPKQVDHECRENNQREPRALWKNPTRSIRQVREQ